MSINKNVLSIFLVGILLFMMSYRILPSFLDAVLVFFISFFLVSVYTLVLDIKAFPVVWRLIASFFIGIIVDQNIAHTMFAVFMDILFEYRISILISLFFLVFISVFYKNKVVMLVNFQLSLFLLVMVSNVYVLKSIEEKSYLDNIEYKIISLSQQSKKDFINSCGVMNYFCEDLTINQVINNYSVSSGKLICKSESSPTDIQEHLEKVSSGIYYNCLLGVLINTQSEFKRYKAAQWKSYYDFLLMSSFVFFFIGSVVFGLYNEGRSNVNPK